MTADRPALLVLDVDGCLCPLLRPGAIEVDATWPDWHDPTGGSHHAPVSRQMADGLAALPAERVWCTNWQHEANRLLGPGLGWEQLPVLEPDPGEPWSLHVWKLAAVERYVASRRPRAVVWVDDELSDATSPLAVAVGRRPNDLFDEVPHLLVGPNRYAGLTPAQINDVAAWMRHVQHDHDR